MHIVMLAGRTHFILAKASLESMRHHPLGKVDRLLSHPCSEGETWWMPVVRCGHSAGSSTFIHHRDIPESRFDALEQGLEIALAETVIALSLDEFKEKRTDLRLRPKIWAAQPAVRAPLSFRRAICAVCSACTILAMAGRRPSSNLVIAVRTARHERQNAEFLERSQQAIRSSADQGNMLMPSPLNSRRNSSILALASLHPLH